MSEFLLISGGAVLGANARYWITNYFASQFGTSFPAGTLLINITGSFLLGFIMALIANNVMSDPAYRLFLGTGFLGAYTTFSAFSYDTVALLERGDLAAALWNVVLSVGCSLLAAFAGIMAARYLTLT